MAGLKGADSNKKKYNPEFSPAQTQGYLIKMFNITENSRLLMDQALRTKSIEIEYFGEHSRKDDIVNRPLYDHFYHPNLDFDKKSQRCDRFRPTRFQNSIHEEERKRVVPVRTSSIYGHRTPRLEELALTFHGKSAEMKRSFYNRCKVNLQPELEMAVVEKRLMIDPMCK
ncbi:uncharacterized protein LOC120351809 [Nilaparvata lugens]|uniref:uncharacterized protein LOC120351809 n=1 Tax=Nilaparvata lugens TaxID=108931 RepID=UPI00193E8247|nr:uncharacterized protein LOC120351809 [Nilaparvata lugens]